MANNSPNLIKSTTEGVMIHITDRFGAVLPSAQINRDILFTPDDLALRDRAEALGRTYTKDINAYLQPSDKTTLNFLSVWLNDVAFSWERQRTNVARTGIATKYHDTTIGGHENIEMHVAVPIDLKYSMTYWTRYRESMDMMIQEFMFWTHENPNIEMFYDRDKSLAFQIKIDSRVEHDDMKITAMYREGKYWKHTFGFTVEAWIIKGVVYYTAKTIILKVYAPDVALTPGPDETKVLELDIDSSSPDY